MIGQIGYLGQVSLRKGLVAAVVYTLGIALGGATLGFVLGGAGWMVRWVCYLRPDSGAQIVLILTALVAVVGGLRDLGFIRYRLVQPFKQVPRAWFEVFGPNLGGFLSGFAVGLAYTTMIQYSLYYVVFTGVLLLGRPWLGAAILGTYGLANGGLLAVDTLVMGVAPHRSQGLLGEARVVQFGRWGGAALLACGVFLMLQSRLFGLL